MRLRCLSAATAAFLLPTLMAGVSAAQLAPPAPLGGGTGTPPGSDGTPAPMNNNPPPNDPNAAGATAGTGTEPQSLKDAEKEDNGRNFELFWAQAEAGLSYMNLASFSQESLAIEKKSAFGGVFGLGAGVRFLLFTLGARIRMHQLSVFSLWQINGVLGMQIPAGSWDIGFGLHGGYSFVGRISGDAFSTSAPNASSDVSVRGFNLGLGASLDYYLTPLFSIGAGITGEALFLKRPPLAIPADVPADQRAQLEQSDLYKNSGTSAGIGVAGGLRLGLHLGI